MRFAERKAENAELKACPFCGAEGRIGIRDVPTMNWTGHRTGTQCFYFVGCHSSSCEIKPQVTRSKRDKQEAFDLWNKRAKEG